MRSGTGKRRSPSTAALEPRPAPLGAQISLIAAIASFALAAAACGSAGGLFRGGPSGGGGDAGAAERGAPAGTAFDAEGLAVYLEMMRFLIEGDSLTQAETYRTVADAADYAPTTTNRLKHALALAVPGHPGSDAQAAERSLSALLAAGDTLLPEERVLAVIQLHDVEQRLILDTAAEQLRAEMASAIEAQDAAAAARVEGLLEENRRLQLALEDATEKLNAITSIEQSIREREDGAN